MQGQHSRALTSEQALRLTGIGLLGGRALIDDDAVGQVRRHDEIVLHDKRCLLRMHDEPLDHLFMGLKPRQHSDKPCQVLNFT